MSFFTLLPLSLKNTITKFLSTDQSLINWHEGVIAIFKKYLADKNYILRKVAGSHVLISIGDNIANFNGYIQLSDSAAFLWKKLAEPKSLIELAESLQEEFDVDEAQAESDVKDFMEELIRAGMVSVL